MTRLETILEGFRVFRKQTVNRLELLRGLEMRIMGLFALVLAVSLSAAAFFGGSGETGKVNNQAFVLLTPTPQVLVFADDSDRLAGSNFDSPITVTDTTGLGILGYQFDIFYDPAVIFPQGGPNGLGNKH